MDINALFRHKAFSNLAPEQLQLIQQFAKDVQGKGLAEASKMYRQLNQRVSQINPITAAQRSAIVEAIMGFVPEKDKQKFSGIIKMLSK